MKILIPIIFCSLFLTFAITQQTILQAEEKPGQKNDSKLEQQCAEANILLAKIVDKNKVIEEFRQKQAASALEAGKSLFQQERYADAQEKFLEALKHSPEDKSAAELLDKCRRHLPEQTVNTPKLTKEEEALFKLGKDPLVVSFHNLLGHLGQLKYAPKDDRPSSVLASNSKLGIAVIGGKYNPGSLIYFLKETKLLGVGIVSETAGDFSVVAKNELAPTSALAVGTTTSTRPPFNAEELKTKFMTGLKKDAARKLIPTLVTVISAMGEKAAVEDMAFPCEILSLASGEKFSVAANATSADKRRLVQNIQLWWQKNKYITLGIEGDESAVKLQRSVDSLFQSYRRSDDRNTWQYVQEELGRLGPEARAIFLEMVRRESDTRAKILGVCLLVRSNGPEVAQALEKDLESGLLPIPEFVQFVIATDDRRFIPLLKMMAGVEKDPDLKFLLGSTAIELGEKEGLKWLIDSLDSSRPEIRRAAVSSLRIYAVENFPYDPDATPEQRQVGKNQIEKWWQKNAHSFELPTKTVAKDKKKDKISVEEKPVSNRKQ